MKCDRCEQHEGVVTYTEIEEGVKRSRWLCEECLKAVGGHLPGAEPEETFDGLGGGVEAFLSAMMGDEAAAEPGSSEQPAACAACGHTLEVFQDTGLLGCPECYVAFRQQLRPVLQRYHRATGHQGKAPRGRGPQAVRRLEIARLRHALEQAVAAEHYEEAARLRDAIREQEARLARPVEED